MLFLVHNLKPIGGRQHLVEMLQLTYLNVHVGIASAALADEAILPGRFSPNCVRVAGTID